MGQIIVWLDYSDLNETKVLNSYSYGGEYNSMNKNKTDVLLHFDNQENMLKNFGSKDLEFKISGNPIISSDRGNPFDPNGKALYLDGNSYIYLDNTKGIFSHDFQIDLWINRYDSYGTSDSVIEYVLSNNQGFMGPQSNKYVYIMKDGGWLSGNISSIANYWNHFCFQKLGNTVNWFYVKKGDLVRNNPYTNNSISGNYLSDGTFYLGKRSSFDGFKGYISELRITSLVDDPTAGDYHLPYPEKMYEFNSALYSNIKTI